jgi:hypothetical protein
MLLLLLPLLPLLPSLPPLRKISRIPLTLLLLLRRHALSLLLIFSSLRPTPFCSFDTGIALYDQAGGGHCVCSKCVQAGLVRYCGLYGDVGKY